MNAIIASHRLTPGHVSHMLANAELLSESGYVVALRWASGLRVVTDEASAPFARFTDIVDLREGSLYVLWAPSVQGLAEVLAVRLLTRARVVYVFHEPYTTFASYRNAGFPFLKTCKVVAAHVISSAIVALSHTVILPSANAYDAFARRYDSRARTALLPLLFGDEARDHVPSLRDRPFVSYVGTIAEDHAFDGFLAFVEYCIAHSLLNGMRFQIATRSVLPLGVQERLAPHAATGQVVVQSGRPLTNGEINKAYGSSLVVWNAYKRSMQSGVLPKAYMFGTPVLVSTANRSEFFVDDEHGVEVSNSYEPHELAQAVHRIERDFDRYSRACRNAFFRHFHYRANAHVFLGAIS